MTPQRWWTRAAAAAVVVLTGTLVGCGRPSPEHTAEDMARSREQVRAVAAEDLAAMAEALGGTVVAGRGEYDSGGDGMVNNWRYSVSLSVDGPATTSEQLVEAIEALGYDVVQTPDPDAGGDTAVIGERDGLRVGGSVGSSQYPLWVYGPFLTLPMEEGTPPPEQESIDLPGYGTLPMRRPAANES